MEYDLLNIPDEVERQRHKLRRTIPAPNSYFIALKEDLTSQPMIVFSHSQTTINSTEGKRALATPTGGKVKIGKGCHIRINNKEQEGPSAN